MQWKESPAGQDVELWAPRPKHLPPRCGLPRSSAGAAGESLYLRLSTKPVDQSLAPPPSPQYRSGVLRGGYRLIDARGEPGWDPESNGVHLFAPGVMVTEAGEAARAVRAR